MNKEKEEFETLLSFITTASTFKDVDRFILVDNNRYENNAEHTWHCCLMALALYKKLDEKVDIGRVLSLLVVHDVPEIETGDVWFLDKEARKGKKEREAKALKGLLAELTPESKKELSTLWHEYEKAQTPEARFAKAIDKIQPIVENIANDGIAWKKEGLTEKTLRESKEKWVAYDTFLASFTDFLLTLAVERKLLKTGG